MCRGERCPTDTHFMQNTGRVVRRDEEIGGWSTWTIGVAHRDCSLADGQPCERMVNTDSMPNNKRVPSLKPMCQRKQWIHNWTSGTQRICGWEQKPINAAENDDWYILFIYLKKKNIFNYFCTCDYFSAFEKNKLSSFYALVDVVKFQFFRLKKNIFLYIKCRNTWPAISSLHVALCMYLNMKDQPATAWGKRPLVTIHGNNTST